MARKYRFILCITAVSIFIGVMAFGVGFSALTLNTEHPEYISVWERTKDIITDPVNDTWKHRLLLWRSPVAT